MQTPKARNSSSEVPQKKSPRGNASEVPLKISPRAVRSREAPQKISPRAGSQDVPQKASTRVVRRLKTGTPDSVSPSASASSPHVNSRTPKERRPKLVDKKSPQSVESEKCPSKVTELESQITQLKNDLQEKLSSSETCKKQAEAEAAKESKEHPTVLSLELDQSPKQKPSEKSSEDLLSEFEIVQKQHSADKAALESAIDEIKELKAQLKTVAESEATKTKNAEAAETELESLKLNLADTLSLVEDMKKQLKDSKDSEAQAQALVSETLLQLESAKKTVETLKSDGNKFMEAYNAISSELDQSRTRANQLEEVVCKLQTDTSNVSEGKTIEIEESKEVSLVEAELSSLKSEVERLRADLEAAEIKYNEEKTRSTVEIKNAYTLVEQIKTISKQREKELEGELRKLRTDIEVLQANLMDKETELQGICEENENLTMKLENSQSGKGENELEKELRRSILDIENLKANLMDKETELQNILEENEILKTETSKENSSRGTKDEVAAEVEAAKAAEREALMKLGYMKEEVDKSNRRVARVTEQLDAAQAANAEMEADLRRLKVQSDQWRKAAEVATAMLSNGNNGKFMERTGSMDSHYSPRTGKVSSPYFEDDMDAELKRKNPNMLKRIGELWKKPLK